EGGSFLKLPQGLPTLHHSAKIDITDPFPAHDKESMWTARVRSTVISYSHGGSFQAQLPCICKQNDATRPTGLGEADRQVFPGEALGIYRLSQFRAKPSSPCGMKMTIAIKMIPTGMR